MRNSITHIGHLYSIGKRLWAGKVKINEVFSGNQPGQHGTAPS
jgi:hypothetical protein